MRKLINNIAHSIFTVGGISVIVIIVLMIAFLSKEVLPLFHSASVSEKWSKELVTGTDSTPLCSLLSDDSELSLIFDKNGYLVLQDTEDEKILETWELPGPVYAPSFKNKKLMYSSNGYVYVYPLQFVRDSQTGLEVSAELGYETTFEIPYEEADYVTYFENDESESAFAVASGNQVYYYFQTVEEGLWGDDEVESDFWKDEFEDDIKGLAFYPDGTLLIALANGKISAFNREWDEIDSFYAPSKISCIGQLIGDKGILVGGVDGKITVWSQANTEAEGKKFFNIHTLKPMKSQILGFSTSMRDRSLIAWDKNGTVNMYYSTTEALRLTIKSKKGFSYIMNPKANCILGFNHEEKLYFKIKNPHPDISFNVLFGKVWYEGYPKKIHAWQSTGGTNEFEPKFSLIPLIFGTIKGALYAMFFALPLAIAGALFMNQFLHPSFHKIIKPVIEIMAGLPSVIIGFLAGLWLAPLLQDTLPGVLLGIILIPIVILVISFFLDKLSFMKNIDSYKYEIFILIPFIVLVFWLSVKFTPVLNNIFFGGDFKQFIFNNVNSPYDQRNAIIVGFAMGFAVIPLIFSLAEDALSFVPKEIIAGSLALGLSRWQTATGVAIKAAMPGILSATMIGFGRAVGETMIVLMATGNTPVLSWLPFNGFRTLSANIAVELPEAPVGGSAYRILFLTALLLFGFTFVINLLTDILRKHMQKRFT